MSLTSINHCNCCRCVNSMADLSDIIARVNIQSCDLKVDVIQDVLLVARKRTCENDEVVWTKITDNLWNHLQEGLQKYDDQLLCSTCFYTTLRLTSNSKQYLDKVLTLINHEITLKQNSSKDGGKLTKISNVVSLMYGMFQSTFLTNVSVYDIPNINEVLQQIFELLMIIGSEYSRHTFIAFKTIHSFKKVIGTKLQSILYSKDNINRLLNLVNHNWENPITGIRDLNSLIFQTLIGVIDKDQNKALLHEINSFNWSKAKYLMLAEIIERKHDIVRLTRENEWVDAIMYSLHKTGLVSAGTDMYCAIIKNLKTDGDWVTLFLCESVKILNGTNDKAIENFSNYWCLITFKRFPLLAGILLNELMNLEKTNQNLYSCLCIIKQGNKLNALNKDILPRVIDDYVKEALGHWNTHIRMTAFEILTSYGRHIDAMDEFDIILKYLKNNINTDCTVLRISMLHNFKTLASDLHAYYLNNNRNCENDNLLKFYKNIQEFIIKSLNLDGNYQRKLATIKLCHALLHSVTNVPKKGHRGRRMPDLTLLDYLKEKNCLILFEEKFIKSLFSLLKDPADDIRENIMQLLLYQYYEAMTTDLVNHLLQDAQDSIKSKFFFQISCGQSNYKLVSSLLLKKNYSGLAFESLDDVFSNVCDEIIKEHEIKRDIVQSIEAGKQIHSLLGVLIEILKVSKQNKYKIETIGMRIPQILQILNDTSNQFMWEKESATSSDFSKMSDMIQNIISTSGYDPLDENDYTKISGLQQIVLNCLWFNVKSSCDLASLLIQFLDDDQIEECETCVTIIMHVLETSRHKGVIESAGSSLGRAIQYLTSLPDKSRLSSIPLTILKCKLNELISYANMASVTRRGAGLSIMVHRIVSSDMKSGKPLFHYFMETLLETCCTTKENSSGLEDNQKDLPKAIYIHFLTRIVIDSSLASDMMYYSVELAEIAFENLTSSHWQIRNAALQLYGALIPKLIGQKKASGAGDETVATVACDEFRTHSPKLWNHIRERLQNAHLSEDTVQAHSNTMPLLNVLANLAKRYNFSFDSTMQENNDLVLFSSLILFLGSPIFTVRRLSARCIYNIYDTELILKTLILRDVKSENFLHGCLLLTVDCYKNCSKQNNNMNYFEELKNKFCAIMNEGQHSYVNRQVFEELLSENEVVYGVQETLLELKQNIHAPGIFHWANSRIRKFAMNSSWEKILDILKLLLENGDFENKFQIIYDRLKTENVSQEILTVLHSTIINHREISQSSILWKILYHISLQVKTCVILPTANIFKWLESKEMMYRMRYAVPFLAANVTILAEPYLSNLSDTILSLCDPETSDVDMRYIGALANIELAKNFKELSDEIKTIALKSAIILLQDEDEDVRDTCIDFYRILRNSEVANHSYICLEGVLNKQFLESLFDNPQAQIPVLSLQISTVLNTYSKSNIDEYNPFSSDSKNIYFEVNVVRQLLCKIQLEE